MVKRGVRWAALLAIAVAGIWVPSAQADPPAGYTLEWSDEFNGAVGTPPNPANWEYDTGSGGFGNNELETYTSDTAHSHVVADPNATDGTALQIMATDDNNGVGANGQYTSARINSAGKVQPEYGYVEARVRMPFGQGIWPAFWELGADIGSIGWPACGEQDIMESIGSQLSTNHGSLHGPGYSGGSALTATYTLSGGDVFHTEYHTFSELWTPTSVSFFVDGNRYETHTPADADGNAWPFGSGEDFILSNMAVGGNFPGNPDGSTVFPQTMLIDYIRVYSTPFNGPHGIPGVVQAEDFDNGGLDVSYNTPSNSNQGGQYRPELGVGIEATQGGGFDVGWTGPNQWMKYTVNVNATGTYNFLARVSAPAAGSTFHVEDENGNNITGTISVPNTGAFQTWATVNASVSLTAGAHTLKLVEETGGFNIDYIGFTSSTGAFNGPHNVPGVVQAEDYNQGGEGVGFHSDSILANPAGVYRNDPITVESSMPNGYDISSTAAGQWLKYNINVATTGQYNVAFRVASSAGGGTFHVVDENGNNLTGTVTVPRTGGVQVWTNVDAIVNLTAGAHTLQLVEDSGGYSIDQMSFSLGFNGPHNISGTIGAADYDQGGEGIAYHMMSPFSPGSSNYRGSDAVGIETSTPSGFDIGWTQAGQYTNYTVFVAQSGNYQAAFSVASGANGGQFHLEDENGNNLTGTMTVQSTGGWQTFTTLTANVALTAGGHVLRLVQDTGGYNLQSIAITSPSNVPTTVASIGLAPTSVTGGSGSTATVTLSANAVASIGPDGHTLLNGQAVQVASDNPAASIGAASNVITVNGATYAVVAAGQSQGMFPVTTIGVSAQTTASISASLGGTTKSTPLTITGGGTVPAAPANLQATPANSQVTLTWTASTGASSYNVYMGTSAGGESITPVATGVSGTTTLVTNLTNNSTTYYFVVKAVNFVGVSAASNEVSATPTSPAPPAPTNLKATAGNGGIALTWSGSTGATSYSLFEGTSSGGEGATAVVTGITTTNYNIVGLTNGTTYYFYVEAAAQGQLSTPSNEASATPANTAVGAPTNLTAASGSAKVVLQWAAATGATAYNVYMGTARGAENTTPIATNVIGATYTATGLTNGKRYFFTVSGVGQAGVGLPSNEASAIPAPAISYPAGVQFMSSPIDYSSTASLDTLFGVTGVTLATWETAGFGYAVTPTAPADKLRIGVGYWVNLKNAVTLNGAGDPADATQNFTISLGRGWNAVGDPFFTTVGQSTLLVNGLPWTQADSGSSPLVATTIWAYSSNSNSYFPAVSIAPEQGYWVYAYSNCTLTIPHP